MSILSAIVEWLGLPDGPSPFEDEYQATNTREHTPPPTRTSTPARQRTVTYQEPSPAQQEIGRAAGQFFVHGVMSAFKHYAGLAAEAEHQADIDHRQNMADINEKAAEQEMRRRRR